MSKPIILTYGRLAQLVRASALQAEGHRFESYIAHHAEIAQLVEQLTCNRHHLFFGGIAKWSNAADCKSVLSGSMVQIHVPPPLVLA